MPRFSILIPARNEEQYLPGCLESIRRAAEPFPDQVERIVAVNRCTDRTEEIALAHGASVVHSDARNLAKIRNAAANAATGDIIVTIDADSRMSPKMLLDIERLLRTGRYIGGGVMIWPERWSLGIVATAIMLLPVVLRHRVSGGLFWCLREDFEAIGGFNESWITVEDIDFAKRLKAHGKSQGKRFTTILKSHIVTSCRKFDRFGDWYLIRNPGMVRRIFTGKSQKDADHFYYDFERSLPNTGESAAEPGSGTTE
jgi:glycosyltransferase involved in cell wall biosynthesis